MTTDLAEIEGRPVALIQGDSPERWRLIEATFLGGVVARSPEVRGQPLRTVLGGWRSSGGGWESGDFDLYNQGVQILVFRLRNGEIVYFETSPGTLSLTNTAPDMSRR